MADIVSASGVRTERLQRELGLFDVFAVSTGAMFSSGFFLLPGLAFAQSGASVIFAYLLAGVLILPAMFSKAELSTALPRAGGTYFFLDRALGPMAGTVGGLGTYLALTLKTAFALIGIGAYAAIFVELPIKPVAIALTVVFVIINMLGAKETTALQRWLVLVLLSIMAIFIVKGIAHIAMQPAETVRSQFTPFFEFGAAGLLSTVGFVFVSYAGLTKVASVAEEVRNPERNIPLGMMLSLGATAVVYGAGVFIIVGVVDAEVLATDLTPVATAAEAILGWMPGRLGMLLIVIAALAAFASTGNAGMLAASRYPLAMARDNLLPRPLAALGRFGTPVPAILATGGLMVVFLVALDAEGIAKLASAFQLFIFILVNFAVIVMRESHIQSYDPGYRSPLYPWMQLFGMIASGVLIFAMGWAAMLFTLGVIAVCMAWYFVYASPRVRRHGAIYHWFSRLGQRRFDGLDREFRGIMKEKGLRDADPFEQIVMRSVVINCDEPTTFEQAIELASTQLAERLASPAEEIKQRFMQGTLTGHTPVTGGVALPHFRTVTLEQPEMVLLRSLHPIVFPGDDPLTEEIEEDVGVHAVFFLVSPEVDPAWHLRILAQIAGRVDEPSFGLAWTTAANDHELREVLLRDERFATISVVPDSRAAVLAGQAIRDLELPEGCLIAAIARGRETLVPSGSTVLDTGDRVTVIGEPEGIAAIRASYETTVDDFEMGAVGWAAASTVLENRLRYIAAKNLKADPDRTQEALDALERISKGTYGQCVECGQPIETQWLLLRPEAVRCLVCEP